MAAGQRGRPKGSTGAKNTKKRVNTYNIATPAAKQVCQKLTLRCGYHADISTAGSQDQKGEVRAC